MAFSQELPLPSWRRKGVKSRENRSDGLRASHTTRKEQGIDMHTPAWSDEMRCRISPHAAQLEVPPEPLQYRKCLADCEEVQGAEPLLRHSAHSHQSLQNR